MVKKRFLARGDIVHLDFNPAAGHEMKGPHYGVVISPREFNRIAMPFIAPITTGGKASRMAGFAVSLTGTGLAVTGVVQCDQVKPIDPVARKLQPQGETVPEFIMDEILARLETVFGATVGP